MLCATSLPSEAGEVPVVNSRAVRFSWAVFGCGVGRVSVGIGELMRGGMRQGEDPDFRANGEKPVDEFIVFIMLNCTLLLPSLFGFVRHESGWLV